MNQNYFFCPNKNCRNYNSKTSTNHFKHAGHHATKAFGEVPRYQCMECGKTFSDQTFSLKLQPEHLLQIKGLSQAKAVKICAALEFSRRIYCPAQGKIKTPSNALKFVQHFSDGNRRCFSVSL